MRFQSVSDALDGFEESFLLTFGRFPYRNYPNGVCRLGMGDGNNTFCEEAEGYQAFFIVFVAVIGDRRGWTRKNLRALDEIDAVLTKVDFTLFFVPLEFNVSCHHCSYSVSLRKEPVNGK